VENYKKITIKKDDYELNLKFGGDLDFGVVFKSVTKLCDFFDDYLSRRKSGSEIGFISDRPKKSNPQDDKLTGEELTNLIKSGGDDVANDDIVNPVDTAPAPPKVRKPKKGTPSDGTPAPRDNWEPPSMTVLSAPLPPPVDTAETLKDTFTRMIILLQSSISLGYATPETVKALLNQLGCSTINDLSNDAEKIYTMLDKLGALCAP